MPTSGKVNSVPETTTAEEFEPAFTLMANGKAPIF